MLRSTVTSLFTLLITAALLASCEKCGNVTITKPTAEDSAWLVYKKDAAIAFVTQAKDTIRYKREAIFAQNIPGDGFAVEDECIDALNVQVRTLLEDDADKQPALGTRVLSKPDSLIVELSVGDMGVWEIDKNAPTYESLEVNKKTYYDVFEITPVITQTSRVEKILFNKEFGFLSIRYKSSNPLEPPLELMLIPSE